jgi:hypothetical protein
MPNGSRVVPFRDVIRELTFVQEVNYGTLMKIHPHDKV